MKTKVIFRMWRGGVIALFPREPGDSNPATCLSYEHIGQHGGADCVGIIRDSRPATHDEWRELYAELRRIGYKLDVRKRTGRADLEARRRALQQQ